MKKYGMIVLVAAASFTSFVSNAQVFSPGIKGGLNSGYLTGFDGNNRLSGHIGFFLHQPINGRWCFQPEVVYSGEGQRYFSDGEERTIALDYIQIPLMFQYYASRNVYFEFGPQLGLLASARDKGQGGDVLNVKNDFKSSQVGLNLGIGFNLANNIGLYGRYSFGLSDVSGGFDNVVDESRVAQLGVAVRLK